MSNATINPFRITATTHSIDSCINCRQCVKDAEDIARVTGSTGSTSIIDATRTTGEFHSATVTRLPEELTPTKLRTRRLSNGDWRVETIDGQFVSNHGRRAAEASAKVERRNRELTR